MNRLYTNASGTRYVELAEDRRDDMSSEVLSRSVAENVWDGLYDVLENPDPVLQRTGYRIDVLHEIRRDAHVKACIKSRKAGVLRRHWKIERGEATARAAEVLEQVYKSINIRTALRGMLNVWGYGYQACEVGWQREGNLLLPTSIVAKPQEWFWFGNDNGLRRIGEPFDDIGVPVEPYRFLLLQSEADYRNPYGEADFSICFWPVTFKKGGIKFWAKFLEKFGMPHAVGKLPKGAPSAERSTLLVSLMRMVQDACAVFPDDASVELVEAAAKGASGDLYKSFAEYHDREISKVILGHGAAADSTPGRLGNETGALDVRSDIIDDDCMLIQDAVNQLSRWVLELNPSLGSVVPEFELCADEDVDEKRSERDERLLNTGKIKIKQSYFLRTYDYEPGEIEVIDEPQQQGAEFAAPPARGPLAGQREVDELEQALPDELLQRQIEQVLGPVLDLIENAASYDDVRAGIAELYPKLDTRQVEKTLEQALFLAQTQGRSEVIAEGDA
jgi:phage gp29-like protein